MFGKEKAEESGGRAGDHLRSNGEQDSGGDEAVGGESSKRFFEGDRNDNESEEAEEAGEDKNQKVAAAGVFQKNTRSIASPSKFSICCLR